MKEAVVSKGPKVTIQDSPIPKPEAGQVGDPGCLQWEKVPEWLADVPPMNQGDDISGIVHSVGEGVIEFKAGDRVAAFHQMVTPGGSYAEYAVSPAHTTFHLPKKTSFEEGAALPLAYLTAAVGLYASPKLNLPHPWSPTTKPTPLLVYGAASAVGSYVVQLAARSNIHPLICIAGRAQAHVEKLIDRSKGDTIIDYRKGDEAVVQGIRDALKGENLEYAYDAVAELGKSTIQNICQVLDQSTGRITLVLPPAEGWTAKWKEIPGGVSQSMTNVGGVHAEFKELGLVYSRYLTGALDEGWFKPQPQEVVPGGLGGIETALGKLKDGTASAVKYVFKIADTEGAGSGQ